MYSTAIRTRTRKKIRKAKNSLAAFSMINENLRKHKSWRLCSPEGSWFCPYCCTQTDVMWIETKPDRLAQNILTHLSSCTEYLSNPDRFKPVSEINSAAARAARKNGLIDNIISKVRAGDKAFIQKSSEGCWICPYCISVIPEISLSSATVSERDRAEQIADHLIDECAVNIWKMHPRSGEEVQAFAQSFIKEEKHIEIPAENGIDTVDIGRLRSELAILRRKITETEELEKSVIRAREVVANMLPDEIPQPEGYDIATYFQACYHIGGDFYDFISLGKGRFAFVVGDVSGHGLEAALVMGMVKKAINTRAKYSLDPKRIISEANDDIYPDMKKGTFATCFFGIFDTCTHRVACVRAGHNYSFIYSSASGHITTVKSNGLPLGIRSGREFSDKLEVATCSLNRGDTFIQYTDGLTEAMNGFHEEFGEDRFTEAIQEYGNHDSGFCINNIVRKVECFKDGQAQNDDLFVAAVRRKSCLHQ